MASILRSTQEADGVRSAKFKVLLLTISKLLSKDFPPHCLPGKVEEVIDGIPDTVSKGSLVTGTSWSRTSRIWS
jgi:hypothetical protein